MHSDWDTANAWDDHGVQGVQGVQGDDDDFGPSEEEYETWCDYFSDELVTMYHNMKDHVDACGLPLLEHMGISEFCHFVYDMSSKRKPAV